MAKTKTETEPLMSQGILPPRAPRSYRTNRQLSAENFWDKGCQQARQHFGSWGWANGHHAFTECIVRTLETKL